MQCKSVFLNSPVLRACSFPCLCVPWLPLTFQEVPENRRRVSLIRGIVIARRNGGINTTFRIRRILAGVGVEMVFPL